MANFKKRLFRMISAIVGVATLTYASTVAAAYYWQRSLMYFPDPARVRLPKAALPMVEEINLKTADGETIVGWTVPPKPGKPVILYFHGNGGNFAYGRIERFRELTSDGAGLLAINYRGFGGSTGTPTEVGLHLDADAAYQAATDRYGADNLVGYGESLGTGVVTQLATRKPLKAVLLEAPYTSTASVAGRLFPWIPVSALMIDQFRSDHAIKSINAPLMIIHGDQDVVVPFDEGKALYELAAEPKQFVHASGAGHNDLYSHGAGERARAFFGATVH